MLMFPEQVPTEPDHPSAAKMREVRDKLPLVEGRTLVFFGDSADLLTTRRRADRGADPGAELQEPIAGAGHFLQEDAGEEVGRRIAAWLTASTYTRVTVP
jgi:haloalkane dehalogenase